MPSSVHTLAGRLYPLAWCVVALALLAAPAESQLKVDSAVIRGTVTNVEGDALDSVKVSLLPGLEWRWTDKTGRYRFVVDASEGPFLLSFGPPTTEHVFQYLGGVLDRQDAEWVSVASGDTIEVDVALPKSPLITGVVTDPDGEPMPGISVTVMDSVTIGTYAETDDAGRYQYLNAWPRSPVRILFEGERRGQTVEWWFQDADSPDDAWPIPLRTGDTVRVDATLPYLPPPLEPSDDSFTLVGMLYQKGPVPNAELSGWWTSGGEPDSDGGGELAFQTFTDEFGWFEVEVEPRDDDRLKLLIPGWFGDGNWYSADMYGNVDDWVDATAVETPAGEVREIQAYLNGDALTAQIDLIVSDRGGVPLSGIDVWAWPGDPFFSEFVFRLSTDDQGRITSPVPAANYTFQYETPEGTEIWQGGGGSFDDAERVDVLPGDSVVVRDSLPLGATAIITGSVTDERGNPLAMGVGVFSDEGMIRQVTTEDGRYRVRIPTEDQPIHLWVHDTYGLYGGIEKWHADGSTRAEATAVPVEPGQETRVDVTMRRMPPSWGDRDALGGRDAGDVWDDLRDDDTTGGDQTGGDDSGDVDPSGDPLDAPLDGAWVRRDSNNPRNDGMRIRISGGQAVLTYLPPSGSRRHSVGQIQWQGVGGGALRVRGSDGQYYSATLTREGPDVVHIDVSASGPGNDQTWVRGGPDLAGEWVRVAGPSHPLDGVRVRVEGDEGLVRYLPPTADELRVGQALWTDIGVGGSAKVTAANGAYMDGSLTLEGEDILRVTVTGVGETQLWVRPGVEQRVRSGMGDVDLEEEEGETEQPEDAWGSRRAVLNLATAEAASTLQSAGDEPWLSLIRFTFRFDDIISIDVDDAPAISPLPVGAHPRSVRGNNYFREGEVHPVQIASYSLGGIQPLTAFGLVPVVIEQAKRGSESERDAAAACLESQIFRRLRELDDVTPDYADRSPANAREVARLLVARMDELIESLPDLRSPCLGTIDRDRLFLPDVAYWIHAPEVEDATLTDWINDAYDGGNLPLFLDDFGTYRMRPSYGARQGGPGLMAPPPVQYFLYGNLRLMGY